ncbi:hypothetical protein LTR04_003802 [Oleoguttula sp. CCFEE 6159]|nr:hypothetical protein LTR04_003802 [Oleoguttula sp. CCFEE 6159]
MIDRVNQTKEDDPSVLRLFGDLVVNIQSGAVFCLPHLKIAVSKAGFQTRHLTRQIAMDRMTLFCRERNDLRRLRVRAETSRLFRFNRRPWRASDERGVFKYQPVKDFKTFSLGFTFDRSQILASIDPNLEATWLLDGTQVEVDATGLQSGTGLVRLGVNKRKVTVGNTEATMYEIIVTIVAEKMGLNSGSSLDENEMANLIACVGTGSTEDLDNLEPVIADMIMNQSSVVSFFESMSEVEDEDEYETEEE